MGLCILHARVEKFATNYTNYHELIRDNSCNSWQKPLARLFAFLRLNAPLPENSLYSNGSKSEYEPECALDYAKFICSP